MLNTINSTKTITRLLLLISTLFTGCSSYEKFKKQADDFEIPSMTYKVDANKVWSAVVSEVGNLMKRSSGDIDHQSQDAGVIKTKWIDNTAEMNFSDSFGSDDKIKSAKYQLVVTVSAIGKGIAESSKVTIYKRQLIENDMFQGWKEIDNDYILEKTLLYRIKRVLDMDLALEKLQKETESKKINEFKAESKQFQQQHSPAEIVPDINKENDEDSSDSTDNTDNQNKSISEPTSQSTSNSQSNSDSSPTSNPTSSPTPAINSSSSEPPEDI